MKGVAAAPPQRRNVGTPRAIPPPLFGMIPLTATYSSNVYSAAPSFSLHTDATSRLEIHDTSDEKLCARAVVEAAGQRASSLVVNSDASYCYNIISKFVADVVIQL